jgi:hypothetical protein
VKSLVKMTQFYIRLLQIWVYQRSVEFPQLHILECATGPKTIVGTGSHGKSQPAPFKWSSLNRRICLPSTKKVIHW